MKTTKTLTLDDYRRVRGMTRAALAGQAEINEKTLDRWCTQNIRANLGNRSKIGRVLGVSADLVYCLIRNGQAAMKETENIQGLRYAVALCEFYQQPGQTTEEERELVRARLQKIRFAAKKALAALDELETKSDAA